MSCIISQDYIYPCRTNQGGIKAVYISSTFNPTNDMTFTYGSGASASEITVIGGATVSFYTFTQRIGQGSYTLTGEQSIVNGTSAFNHTVEITIENVNASLATTINSLLQGQWRIIVLDNLNTYWMVGVVNGCYVTALAGGSHKSYMDGNKTTLTFTAQEPLGHTQVSLAAAISVIA